MSRADLALYMAKAGGRDRCEAMASDGAAPPGTRTRPATDLFES